MKLGPPTLYNVSKAITVTEGEKATFICTASNDVDSIYPLQISWYNDKGVRLKLDFTTNLSVLVFETVNYSDAGEYTCRAFNHPRSFVEQRISLAVKCTYAEVYTIYQHLNEQLSSSNPARLGNPKAAAQSFSGKPLINHMHFF